MEERLTPSATFLDVGANIGLFSILAASKYQAQAIAFEPSAREAERLTRNARTNGVKVNLHRIALGDQDGTAALLVRQSAQHMTNRIVPKKQCSEATACPMKRLDSVLSPEDLARTRVVKIDVEGYEMNVLRGMSEAMTHLNAATFVVEVTPLWLRENGTSEQELYAFFESRGWRPRSTPDEQPQSALQWDAIFDPPLSPKA